MDGIRYVCLDCNEEFDRQHDLCPACGEEMSPDAKVPPGAQYAVYQIRTSCHRCGQPMPLNGPLRQVECEACNNSSSFPPDLWQSLLEDFVEEVDQFGWGDSRGSTMMTGHGTFENTYGKQVPHCPQCHKVLPSFDIPIGADEILTCRKCEAKVPTFPAPAWLQAVLPTARQLYGAQREPEDQPKGSVSAPVEEAGRPIVMQCPQCGSALKITKESERLVPCEYCDADVYLPDDVWRRLHPVKTSDRWMIRFERNAAPAQEPKDDDLDHDLGEDWAEEEEAPAVLESADADRSQGDKSSSAVWYFFAVGLAIAILSALVVFLTSSGK